MQSPHPVLNDRARGWLRFLWDKATTPDDWSATGEPRAWWDRSSTAPMCAFPRFDLSESTYALLMMADQTPAWREVYGRITDELCQRHTTHWAAIDWLTQIGTDPDRARYPEAWYEMLIPEHVRGEYDVPGWTANGIAPWGLQPDPIGSDGNLFFRGFFNLVLSIHKYVSGDNRWEQPFKVAGYNDQLFDWSHHRIAEFMHDQWAERPEGPHCENTKIWPYCLSAAGLGLQLYDAVSGKRTHNVYDNWLEYARDNYMAVSDKGALEWFTIYYDPILGHHHTRGAASGLSVSFYMLPQNREFASFLYEAAINRLGWNNPRAPIAVAPDPRIMLIGLAMARELGDHTTASRLGTYAEKSFEPLFFGTDEERFGWWFGLGEDWPRGQLSALMMMNEVGDAGAWSRPFSAPNLNKFHEPTVSGVDFPTFGIDQAWNDVASGVLHIGTYAATASMSGRETSFDVANLSNTDQVAVLCDGQKFERFSVTGSDTIRLETDVGRHRFQIFAGYRAERVQSKRDAATGTPRIDRPKQVVTEDVVAQAFNPVPMASGCPCCVAL